MMAVSGPASSPRTAFDPSSCAAVRTSESAEPSVPDELKTMQNVVLLPHIGSASVVTRNAMDQLVVDNLKAWFAGKPPLTPVAETPVKASA